MWYHDFMIKNHKTSFLALVRHGQSEWNAMGMWTGDTDVGLSAKGREEARVAARMLAAIPFDYAYTSQLARAIETLDIMLAEMKRTDIPVTRYPALNERQYGIYTGKLKEDVKKQLGEDAYRSIRRGWDHPIEDGESLKDVHKRVVAFFREEVLPRLASGHDVLIVSHGNAMRALAKELEGIADDEIIHLEMKTAEIWLYEYKDGKFSKK